MRLCQKTDLRALEWEGLFRKHRRIIESAFRKQERGENLMLIAVANERPVGQVWIDLARKRKQQTAVFWAMRVVPWLQGLGIGSHLLRAAEQLAAAHNCTAVHLTVDDRNTGARRVYERFGFRVVGHCEHYDWYTTRASGRQVRLRRPQLMMEKELEQAKLAITRAKIHKLKTRR